MSQKLFFVLFLMTTHLCYGQNIAAHYKVSKEVNAVIDGDTHKLGTLTYDGYYYEDGPNTIYYSKPLFLDTYPDGVFRYQQGLNKEMDYSFSIDSVQTIFCRNFDSLRLRYRVDIPGKNNSLNVILGFKRGQMTWEFLQEQRDINGLKCQKAKFVNGNNKLQWEVWFCPDVPAIAGPEGIHDLPGLVVEGENFISGYVYTLVDYKTNVTISKDVFWPREFLKPFIGKK